MSKPDQISKSHPTGKWLVLFAISVLSVVVIVILGTFLVSMHYNRGEEIKRRVDAIRAEGQPVTTQDLASLFPDPPAERDARSLLARTLTALIIPEYKKTLPFFGSTNLLKRIEPMDEILRTNIAAFLNSNQKAIEAISWDKMSNSWLGSGYVGGFSNLTEVPSHLVDLARILCLEAIMRSDSGDGASAAQALSHLLTLRSTIPSDTVLKHLIRRTIEGQACDALERSANRTKFLDADLSHLSTHFADTSPEGMQQTLANERCLGIWIMEMTRKTLKNRELFETGPKMGMPAFLYLWISGRFYNDGDYILFLDSYDQALAAQKLPVTERFKALTAINFQTGAEIKKHSVAFIYAFPFGDWLTKRSELDVEVQAHMTSARTALAVERWRLAHNDMLPDSLNALVPEFLSEVPKDLFDKQPLRFKTLARGYLIYSIGSDFTDDGGKEKPDGAKESDHYDITFIVER